MSVVTDGYRVLGHPVCITNEKYPRNEFIFNFVLVIKESEEHEKYDRLVKKLAELGREIETRGEWLWRDETEDDKQDDVGFESQESFHGAAGKRSLGTSAPVSRSGSNGEHESKSSMSSDDYTKDDGGPRKQPSLSARIAAAGARAPSHEDGHLAGGRGSRVLALIEMLREDLNSYGECLIPIGKVRHFSSVL